MSRDMRRLRAGLAAVLFAMVPGGLTAQELPESSDAPSAFSTIVNAREYDDRFSTVEDVLDELPGVRVRRQGGLGAHSTAAIRGSKSEQVLVLLDGVKLNSSQRGGVDLSTLPLRSIERIEVIRGSGASRFGSDAVGGVVSLTSRRPDVGAALDFSGTTGRYRTFGVDSFVTFAGERVRSVLGYTRLRSDNDFRFNRQTDGQPATLLSPAVAPGDERNTRVGAQFIEDSAFWNAELALGRRSSLSSTLRYYRKDRGQPGNVSDTTRNAKDDQVSCPYADEQYRRVVSSLRWRRSQIAGGDLQLALTHQYERRELRDPFAPNPLSSVCGYLTVRKVEHIQSIDQQTGIELNYGLREQPFGPLSFSARSSLALRYDHLRFDASDPARRFVTNLSLRPEISLFERRVRIFPALSAESARTRSVRSTPEPGTSASIPVPRSDGTEYSPSLGLIVSLTPGLRLKSNYGRAFRRPNFDESYHPDFGFIRGNPELSPEESWNFDVGFELSSDGSGALRDLQLSGAYFHRDIENSIEFIAISQSTFAPVNIESARVRGYELSAQVQLFERLHLRGGYTYLDSEMDSEHRLDDPPLPHRPRNQLFGRAMLDLGAVRLWTEASHDDRFSLTRTGELVTGAPNRQIDLGLSVHLSQLPGLSWFPEDTVVSSEWLNITNNDQMDSLGLPLPDRAWYLRVRGSLR
ncbi:MAG: TonB-dependent receptor [bacterium]|nr:TonB-dependent receptor [bacterium]